MGIPLGLGIMTKSVAGGLPFLMILLFVFFTRKRVSWSLRHLAAGLGLGILIAAPWHIGQLLLHKNHFWNDYVSRTVVARVGHYLTRTKHPTYYLTVLRKGFGVSVYLLPLAAFYGLYRGMKKREDSTVLLLIWALLPLLLFSLSRDKNGWYIAQVYPAMALLLSQFLQGIFKMPWAFAAVVAFLFATGLRFPPPADPARDIKALIPCLQKSVRPGEILYEYGVEFRTPAPNLTFYVDRLTRSIRRRPLAQTLKEKNLFLVTTTDHWSRERDGGRLLCQSGKWVLLEGQGRANGKDSHPSNHRSEGIPPIPEAEGGKDSQAEP
jgi:hypothetical protein